MRASLFYYSTIETPRVLTAGSLLCLPQYEDSLTQKEAGEDQLTV